MCDVVFLFFNNHGRYQEKATRVFRFLYEHLQARKRFRGTHVAENGSIKLPIMEVQNSKVTCH